MAVTAQGEMGTGEGGFGRCGLLRRSRQRLVVVVDYLERHGILYKYIRA